MLVCHYASRVDLGSEMTVFRHQTWPYCGVDSRAVEHTARTAMLISHWAGRVLTQSNSLDGKRIRTQVKSVVLISHLHTMFQGQNGDLEGEKDT